MKRVTMLAALVGLLLPAAGWAEGPAPLVLEAKIPLGPVTGRIDHFAFDPDRQLLFVSELGNDSVGIVDLKERKVLHRLTGLSEPQGVAYHPATSTLYVANAGDGSVRLFQGPEFTPAGRIELGDDADNIRIDSWRNRIVVGYGKGALAVIDPASRKKIGDMPLKGHPESFQFDETGSRIFVNVPDARQIAVLDVGSSQQVSTLDTAGARSNFPMAVDVDEHRLLVAFRSPAKLMAFATRTGKLEGSFDTCRDADDVFVDLQRRRVYVSCGEGVIDVLAQTSNGYERIARIPTAAGARTSLFVAASDRFYLGVRATAAEPAAIWVFRPPS
jgi:DNA-binding beta-propeller fold protein YncE